MTPTEWWGREKIGLIVKIQGVGVYNRVLQGLEAH